MRFAPKKGPNQPGRWLSWKLIRNPIGYSAHYTHYRKYRDIATQKQTHKHKHPHSAHLSCSQRHALQNTAFSPWAYYSHSIEGVPYAPFNNRVSPYTESPPHPTLIPLIHTLHMHILDPRNTHTTLNTPTCLHVHMPNTHTHTRSEYQLNYCAFVCVCGCV